MEHRFNGRTLLLFAIAAAVLPTRSFGVPINFNSSIEFVGSSSIDLSLGELIYAINAGGAAVPNETVDVGGTPVIFQSLANSVTLGNATTNFPNMNNAATPGNLYTVATDQASLDRILDGQAWNDAAAATVTLQNLTPGQFYRVQVIGAADNRGCCAARVHDVHSPDGGTTGFIDRFQDYDADTISHVITALGDFTADSTSQQLVFDGVNNAAFSALILTSSSPSAIPHPQITINRATGAIVLENTNSQAASSLLGYSLTSTAGSFNQAQWTQISTAYDESGNKAVDPNDDWTVLTDPGVSTDLSEFNFDTPGDAAVFSPLQKIDLGTPWLRTPYQDVAAQITLADSSVQAVDVVYTGNAIVVGDLNGDGSINGVDWTQFKSGFGSPLGATTRAASYPKGDLDGDLDQDLVDFGIFKQAFEANNGAGSFAALIASVPEPSSLLLLCLAAMTVSLSQRKMRYALLIVVGLAVAAISPNRFAFAADANFGPSFELVDSSDIDLSFGEFVYAINAAGPTQTRVVNVGGFNVTFEPLQGATKVSTTFLSFSGGPAGTYATVTDQAELDAILNTHSWHDVLTRDVTLLGLQVGASYQVQVIGPADTRTCCAARIHSVTGGAGTPGDISRNQDLDLDTVGHVLTTLGTFTADATSQVLTFSGPDPAAVAGFSGLILTSASPHGLTLTVDRGTGNVTMSNNTPGAISLDSYQIISDGNSLSPTGWSSLSTRAVPVSGFPQGDGTGNGWEKATTPTAGGLTEWYLDDELTPSNLGAGMSINLGSAYNTSVNAEDLEFSYRQIDGAVIHRQVTYVGVSAGVNGDYNNNGTVDAADYTVWRNKLGTNETLPHDAIGGTIGPLHYQQWKNNFGQSAGSGSIAVASETAVPEPTTGLLVFSIVFLAAPATTRIRRK